MRLYDLYLRAVVLAKTSEMSYDHVVRLESFLLFFAE